MKTGTSIISALLIIGAASFAGCFSALAGDLATPRLERFENGWYLGRLPVPVLHIEGSIEEIARAHGALLARHPEQKETITYFAGAFSHRLDSNPTLAAHPWLRALVRWSYRHFIRNALLDYVPDRYRAAYAEFAKAAGLDREAVYDALTIPDGALRLVSLLYGSELTPELPSSLGCTSIIWNSGPGTVLHGRNLDYDGVGYWDAHPLILHVIPNEGLAYVAVTAAGIHAPGLTAFNESGLTLAVHQLTLSNTQASGTPVPVISAEIIRNARSIDDAIAIIRGFPRAGGWAYVLSQGRDRAVIETSTNEVAIRRSGEPFFFQTNHASSPALQAEEIFYSPGSWIDTFSRANRLSRYVQAGATKGWATPESVAAMLGSARLPGGTSNDAHRVAGGTIGKLDNIQSVIMDASHRRLWVAVGTDRRAPNENRYLEYRWGDLRSADEPELTGAEVELTPSDTLGNTGAHLRELLRQAFDQKRLAHDPGARHALLAEYAHIAAPVTTIGPIASPVTGRWAGIFLHVWDELARGPHEAVPPDQLLQELGFALRDPDLAMPSASPATPATLAAAAPAAAVINDPRPQIARHRMSLGHLTRAWLLDLLGRRSEALFEYYVVAHAPGFERLKRAGEDGLRRAFDWDRATALSIDFAGVDLFHY